jgi:predicted small integral membrane protein
MIFRLTRILVMAALALQISLVAFGNITDYGTNLAFVQHVLAMDTIFPDATIHYRAITSVPLQHAAYILIIAFETFAAVLCWSGAWRMWRSRRASAAQFQRSKGLAAAGLSVGLLIWLAGFMGIGGEWFGMWMSDHWNGIQSAFRLAILLLAALIYLERRDAELE